MKVRVGVGLFAALVLGGVVVLGAAAAGNGTRSVTFHLVEKSVGFNFIDNPPRQGQNAPPLMGDEIALTSEILTRSNGHAGWLDATCTISRGGPGATGPCYGVFSFKGGTIVGITRISFSANVTEIAVVGGTGAYRDATGTVRSVSRGQNSQFSDDTFQLELPT